MKDDAIAIAFSSSSIPRDDEILEMMDARKSESAPDTEPLPVSSLLNSAVMAMEEGFPVSERAVTAAHAHIRSSILGAEKNCLSLPQIAGSDAE